MNTLLKVIAVSLLAEEWREHPGRYYVSSLGRVKGTSGARGAMRFRAVQAVSRGGRTYLKIGLCVEYRKVRRGIHQLVAECFIGPRPDGCTQTRLTANGTGVTSQP